MSTSPPMAALRMTTQAGPGLPLVACFRANWMPITASLGVVARLVYLVIVLNIVGRSMLPYSPAPDWLAA